jgi:Ca-activated chloride channel family protein
MSAPSAVCLLVAVAAAPLLAVRGSGVAAGEESAPRAAQEFRAGVELVYVPVTVKDAAGRFVPTLTRDDFVIQAQDVEQTLAVFTGERVPVSLAMVLDVSSSMQGQRISEAVKALRVLVGERLGPEDEVLLFTFGTSPTKVHGWTSDRARLQRSLETIEVGGDTALYQALIEAAEQTRTARHIRRALLVISDGNATDAADAMGLPTRMPGPDVLPPPLPSARLGFDREHRARSLIARRELLVYAIGIDAPYQGPYRGGRADHVDAEALRRLTDDTGGYTEVIASSSDLPAVTRRLADELDRHYLLGFVSSLPQDGKHHRIRVEVRGHPEYRVRARVGYIAEKPKDGR